MPHFDRLSDMLAGHASYSKHRLLRNLARTNTSEVRASRRACRDQIAKVKTIWQIDKTVDVNDFYYPTQIEIDSKAQRIDSCRQLSDLGPLVIEGIAGQGKSIFLRYLAIEAGESGQAIPIFVQLRYISEEMQLSALVRNSIQTIVGTNDPYVVEYLLRKKLFIFLLDGFDEIDNKYRNRTIKELHDFLEPRPNVPVIISARPSSDIQNSPFFQVSWIKPLNAFDRTALIRHLVDEEDVRKMLLGALKGKDNIAGVLITPLLVTLLIITYKAENDIPENLSDFYRSLFITLLRRHDKTKPGYQRERRTGIGNVEFEKVYEILCFLSLNEYKLSLTARELYDFVRVALAAQYLDFIRVEDYIDDLVRITCLLVQDGEKFYYLHKSIPEYFAAQKVAFEKVAENKHYFYRQLRENKISENWYQTIYFLSEIDQSAYVEELLIPKLQSTFGLSSSEALPPALPKFTRELFLKIVGERAELMIQHRGDDLYFIRLIPTNLDWFCNVQLHRVIESTLNSFADSLSDGGRTLFYFYRDRSPSLADGFDEYHYWTRFIAHLNSSNDLKAKYQEILVLRQRVAAIKKRAKPIFQLNLSR